MALTAQEKGLEIILDLAGVEDSLIKSDPGRIRQILTNLLGNAIKFTEEGGVELAVSLTLTDVSTCLLSVKVSDTGIGIS